MVCSNCKSVIIGTDFCLNCGNLVNKQKEIIKNESSVLVAQNTKVGTVIPSNTLRPLINPTYTIRSADNGDNHEKLVKQSKLIEKKAKRLQRKRKRATIFFNLWLLLMVLAIWASYYYRKNIEIHAIDFPVSSGEVAGLSTNETNSFSINLTSIAELDPFDAKLSGNFDYATNIFNLVPTSIDLLLAGSDFRPIKDTYLPSNVKLTLNKYQELNNSYSGEYLIFYIEKIDNWTIILKTDIELDSKKLDNLTSDLLKTNDNNLDNLFIRKIKYSDSDYVIISISEIYIDQVKELSEEKALPLSKQELFKVNYKKFQAINGQIFIYIADQQLVANYVSILSQNHKDLSTILPFLQSEQPRYIIFNSVTDKLSAYFLN